MSKKLSKSQLYLIEGSLIECIEKAKAIPRVPTTPTFNMSSYSECSCGYLLGGTNGFKFVSQIKIKFGFIPRNTLYGVRTDKNLSNIEKDVNSLFATRVYYGIDLLLVSDWILEAEKVLQRVRKAIKKREKNPEKYP